MLQPTGLLDVIGQAWFLWMPLLLLFALVWAGKKFSHSSQGKVSVVEAAPSDEPASGVCFGTLGPERTFWGSEKKGPVPLVGKPEARDGHVLVVGGAGSGKTSCIAIPTLRDYWHASALVVDIKGELFEQSKRPRACVFNPMKSGALGYDPFYLLSRAENPFPHIRDMALTLCPMEAGGAVKDPFWIQAAQNVLTGHLVYGFKHEGSFTETIEVLQSVPPKKLLATETKDRDAGRYLLQFADMDTRTLTSIMVELGNRVVAFATDPQIVAALSKRDIVTPELLEQGYDVFLQLPEYKLAQWKPMISLMVQQFARHFEQRPDSGASPILFLLDEFPRLGKMETVVQGLATLRSKHITIMPVIQSLAQLDATYGSDIRKIICDNCSYKAILGATDADSQQYFSKLVGTYEREKVSTSYEGVGWLTEAKGTSITTEEKPIIRPEEFAYLSDIVLLSPSGVRRVQKQPYYQTSPVAWAAPELLSVSGQPNREQTISPPSVGEQARRATPSREQTAGGQKTAQPQQRQDTTTARYEAAITQLSQSAPTGTPEVSIAYQFYEKLPQKLRADFLAWWQRTHQEPLGGEQEPTPPEQHRDQEAPQGEEEEQSRPESQQDTTARYEAALATLVRVSPAGTPLSTLALTFASKLPREQQPDFLAWWQQHQNGKGR